MFNKNLFSQNLYNLRTDHNLTQQALASVLGISYHSIGKMEKGQRSPSIEITCAIADYFDVSLDYLVGRSDTPERR